MYNLDIVKLAKMVLYIYIYIYFFFLKKVSAVPHVKTRAKCPLNNPHKVTYVKRAVLCCF